MPKTITFTGSEILILSTMVTVAIRDHNFPQDQLRILLELQRKIIG